MIHRAHRAVIFAVARVSCLYCRFVVAIIYAAGNLHMAYVCYVSIKDLSNTDKQQLKACKIILKSASQDGAGIANKPLWRREPVL